MANGCQRTEEQIRNDCVAIWRILVGRAPEGRSIAYGRLADDIRLANVNELRECNHLQRIHRRCGELGIGPLDVLVVSATYWVPSWGYRDRRRGEDDFPGDDELICHDRSAVKEAANRDDWMRTEVQDPQPNHFGV